MRQRPGSSTGSQRMSHFPCRTGNMNHVDKMDRPPVSPPTNRDRPSSRVHIPLGAELMTFLAWVCEDVMRVAPNLEEPTLGARIGQRPALGSTRKRRLDERPRESPDRLSSPLRFRSPNRKAPSILGHTQPDVRRGSLVRGSQPLSRRWPSQFLSGAGSLSLSFGRPHSSPKPTTFNRLP